MSGDDLRMPKFQTGVQFGEEGGGPSQVKGRSVTPNDGSNQPKAAVTEPRTGFIALIQRAVTALTSAAHSVKHSVGSIFTHRTKTPTESTPGEDVSIVRGPTVPTVKVAPLPSPDTEAAGYKTASLEVGKTPVKLYAKTAGTLYKLQEILKQSDLNWEMPDQTVSVGKNLKSLGFSDGSLSKMSGFCMSGFNMTGYITGNEKKRQEALRNSNLNAGSFQSCQPPDKARIAGALALVALNSLVQTVETDAAKYADTDDTGGKKTDSKQVASRKRVIEGLLNICNNAGLQITVKEKSVGGNNLETGRFFFPLLGGMGQTLFGILMDPDTGKFSASQLQSLKDEYSHELVERMVQTTYKMCSSNSTRTQLKAAYGEYCTQTKKPPLNLDGLLFNDALRSMLKVPDFIKETSDLSMESKEQLEKQTEQNFQTWLSANKKVEEDGSITVDVGHIKIMVNNEEELKSLTLKSLATL
ncbi:MAG: hypothetical protein LBD34_02865 [Puniceicoccales bacterium]|nr:hypothetical protein [Puniceicoccales bacterium]